VECIKGHQRFDVDRRDLTVLAGQAEQFSLDIGTGDGRFVLADSRRERNGFFVGVDACRENLARASRLAGSNVLFAVARAEALPLELNDTADQITVNFPWGSLLQGLLDPDSAVWDGIGRIARQGATISLSVNAGALAEFGLGLDEGRFMLKRAAEASGQGRGTLRELRPPELRRIDSTWAKRLAFGRDPRAVELVCRRTAQHLPARLKRSPALEMRP